MSFNVQSQAADIPSNVIPTPTLTPEAPYINYRVLSQAGWAEEAALGQTFNAQSQTPDISDMTTCASFILNPRQDTHKTPDINRLSARARYYELLLSLNVTAQAPDDPSHVLTQAPDDPQYVQTPQGVLRDLFCFITPFNQVLPRFPTNYHIQPLHSPIVPPSKSHSTCSRLQKTPNQGFWRSVVDVLFLGTRIVRQDLDGVKSGGFGSGFLFRVCWFNVFRCPSLYTSLYVSFA